MHVLIVGTTGSGKTSVAVKLCQEYRRKGTKTLVLDPLHDVRWNADHATSNAHEFSEIARNSQQCALFIDESGESVGRYNDEMFWLATRARHYGHKSHFITQRAFQLTPTVRDQCSQLFAFSMSFNDAKLLSQEFNKPELLNCNGLGPFQCYHVDRFSHCDLITVTP